MGCSNSTCSFDIKAAKAEYPIMYKDIWDVMEYRLIKSHPREGREQSRSPFRSTFNGPEVGGKQWSSFEQHAVRQMDMARVLLEHRDGLKPLKHESGSWSNLDCHNKLGVYSSAVEGSLS